MSLSVSFCHVCSSLHSDHIPEQVCRFLPEGKFKRIMIKPNWVIHEESPHFPIQALVTSSVLLDGVVQACLEKYNGMDEITVADAPLQLCNFQLLMQQAGVDSLVCKYAGRKKPTIRFLDLRREWFKTVSGFQRQSDQGEFGDPKGYRLGVLDRASFLEEISDADSRFSVSDYSQEEIKNSHQHGVHRYLVSGSVLECDLFINVPKMKTHQKAGITGALKNLVGINGQKSYLAHYRSGRPREGGDEFPPSVPWVVFWQSRIRSVLQKRSELGFRVLRPFWLFVRDLCGIEVDATRANLDKRFYIAGGSWYGNDTIWRMVYDFNKIIRYAPHEGGQLEKVSQREYLAILDGSTAGEGNGPLQPLPVDLKLIAFSNDPFLMDIVMARMMGFDRWKIPLLKNVGLFQDHCWGAFDPTSVPIVFRDKEVRGIESVPVVHRFIPAPGWRGHIELSGERLEEYGKMVSCL